MGPPCASAQTKILCECAAKVPRIAATRRANPFGALGMKQLPAQKSMAAISLAGRAAARKTAPEGHDSGSEEH